MPIIPPPEGDKRRRLEECLIRLTRHFGYQEMRPPIIEKTELFRRSIGEASDIVEKEMYEFADKKGLSVCLRPEATAGLMRAGIELNLFAHPQRIWCLGPMFRYERPQSGRQRQFDQMDVEAVGFSSPAVDAELIWLSHLMWQELNIKLTLKINALGSALTRAEYGKKLQEYLRDNYDMLDEQSQKRLETAPLRILDSKNPDTQAVASKAPLINDYWDDETREHFEQLCSYLKQLGIKYEIDSRLVRGLDYYDKMVFEWMSDDLGAQNTLCAGGRYDGLIQQLGGKATPAVGFAIGMERLLLILEQSNEDKLADKNKRVLLLSLGDQAPVFDLLNMLKLRDLIIETDYSHASLKSKLKRADKMGVDYVMILGEQEATAKEVVLRHMKTGRQENIHWHTLNETLKAL